MKQIVKLIIFPKESEILILDSFLDGPYLYNDVP
jgi:hypothetical protein